MTTTAAPRSTRSGSTKSARDWLAEISPTPTKRPTAAAFHGVAGLGKTSLGASAPRPVFVIDDQEDGINTLRQNGLVDPGTPVLPAASTWFDVLGMLEALRASEHNYLTVVVDTLGGCERLCHTHVCERDFGGDWGEKGFASYQKGFEVSLPEWRLFLNALDKLRNERGMSIILLAHSLVRPFKNPEGEDYDRYVPDMHHKTWSLTHKWADMVVFMNYYVETVKERRGDKAKGRGGQHRIMYTEYTAAFEAKNRHGLPPEIDMGNSGKEAWANLTAAMAKARKA